MHRLNYGIAIAACGALIAGVTGCGSSKPVRYYVLSSMDRPAMRASDEGAGRTIEVGQVRLPAYLDRQQIVSRSSDNSVQLAEYDRWAELLKDSVPRIIAANLAAMLPGDRVLLYPLNTLDKPDCKVTIDIQRFDGAVGGVAVLEAEWSLSCGKERMPVHLTQPVEGAGYDALAQAQSQLLRALCETIAEAIESIPGKKVSG